MSPFDNCLQDPQSALAKALQNKNLQEFKVALEMDADPTRMDESTHSSTFEKALQTFGCVEFVEECIRRGCKCDYTNRLINKQPINFAADSRDPAIVRAVLDTNAVNVDSKYSNLTPLNSLAKNINGENYDNVFTCMRHLVTAGANPNIPDQGERTPVLHILRNNKISSDQKKEIIQFLLDNTDLDLDTFRDGEARDKLSSQFPELHLPHEVGANITFDTLFTFLRNGNEEKFVNNFNEYHLNMSEKDNQHNAVQENNISLLIEAIKKGLQNAVEVILKSGVNVNHKEKNNSPVEVACTYGNYKALQSLLDQDDLKMKNVDNLLITVIKKLDSRPKNGFSDYYNCFFVLLNSDKIDINQADASGSTPLHYAVKYKNDKAIQELLKRGAYIGNQNAFGRLPIDDVNPDLLEEYFDSCITTNEQKPGDDDFEIIINLSNLIPPINERQPAHAVREEMLPIKYIADSKELKHLLKHPLITSFMFLKWHRLSMIFYVNFLLYALFCGCLVTYIVLNFNQSTEAGVLAAFRILSFLGLIYMILRELLQFLISPRLFLTSAINYMEIILILFTIISLSSPNYEKETQRVIAVFTILLASVELCLLVGSLPVLSISTHMLMLREVSQSFIKSFALYSIFVITFSLCFYVLFGHGEAPAGASATEEDEGGELNKFVNPFTAIIKTIVMLTGEFDAGDIKFQSVASYFVFLLFVFFMAIVLFNLLNGLAVSDTQAIKQQAELNGCICRTNLLSSYEGVMTGQNNTTSFFVKHRPFRSICKNLISLFPNYINGGYVAITPNNRNRILVPTSKGLGDDVGLLKSNGKTFYKFHEETDQHKRMLRGPVRALPCCCLCVTGSCSQMERRTVKAALLVIENRERMAQKQQKLQEQEMRLRKVEHKIDEIFNLLREMSMK